MPELFSQLNVTRYLDAASLQLEQVCEVVATKERVVEVISTVALRHLVTRKTLEILAKLSIMVCCVFSI